MMEEIHYEVGPAEKALFHEIDSLYASAAEEVFHRLRGLAEAAIAEVRETLHVDARMMHLDIAEFNPAPGVRIVLKMPASASPENFQAAAEGLKRHFPGHKIILLGHGSELTEEPDDGSE